MSQICRFKRSRSSGGQGVAAGVPAVFAVVSPFTYFTSGAEFCIVVAAAFQDKSFSVDGDSPSGLSLQLVGNETMDMASMPSKSILFMGVWLPALRIVPDFIGEHEACESNEQDTHCGLQAGRESSHDIVELLKWAYGIVQAVSQFVVPVEWLLFVLMMKKESVAEDQEDKPRDYKSQFESMPQKTAQSKSCQVDHIGDNALVLESPFSFFLSAFFFLFR